MWRILAAILIACGAILVIVYLVAMLFGEPAGDEEAKLPVSVTPQLVARGAYLAKASDCAACHTAPGGPRLAGGLAMQTPIGVIYSPNITPDRKTGIGKYSYGEFKRALRRGIMNTGQPMYPAMPYPSFSRLRDKDLEALYAYFQNSVTPVHKPDKASEIPWPLSMRWPLVYWRWLFAPAARPFTPQPGVSQSVDRGAYLVEGLGHCGGCHTPRGMAFEEEALTPRAGPQYLAGSQFNGWYAPSLRGIGSTGIGLWSGATVDEFLKKGKTRKYAAFGEMSEVVRHSTRYLTKGDQTAIFDFLRTLRPHKGSSGTASPKSEVVAKGQRDFRDNCSACHRKNGAGRPPNYPALARNPIVNARDPASLIHLILAGGTEVRTKSASPKLAMPAFGSAMTDSQIADVLTYVRSHWNNNAPAVSPNQVQSLRESLKQSGASPGGHTN